MLALQIQESFEEIIHLANSQLRLANYDALVAYLVWLGLLSRWREIIYSRSKQQFCL